MSIFKVILFLPLLLVQGISLDEARVRFYEAMELASDEGIPSLIRKLDKIANSAPASPVVPQIHETILVTGLVHPGSVPDLNARVAQLKASAGSNPEMAKVLKRIDILQSYYAAAMNGRPESGQAALSDPVFENSPYGIQAMADASLRAHNYEKSAIQAMRVIENDPHSPLLSNAHMILGLSAAYQGNVKSALTHFQRALAASELPTIYGNPRDYVFAAYRFSRAAPAKIGDIFDDTASAQLGMEIKEPKGVLFTDKSYLLLDKELLLTVSPDGKVLDKKPIKKIEDIAAAGNGKVYSITKDGIDFGGGNAAGLSLASGKKAKRISDLRSFAVGVAGDLYFLDEDAGLLHGTTEVTAGSISVTLLAPVKGHLLRIDNWGNLYVLEKEQKSVAVFSKDGKPLTSISVEPVAGKLGSIEYFAIDSLNHICILTENSIQIFAMKNGAAGLEKSRISTIAFDQNPQFRNLKVLGVNPAGELAATGKNENNWVIFK